MPPVLGTLVLLTLLVPAQAAETSSCDRYAVSGLAPGMTESMVRRRMGAEGVPNVIRNQNNEEASGVDYPGPPTDVYVQYDRRIDKGRSARTVLVRASMPFSVGAAQSLVNRFGVPQAGAESLATGLQDGAAIWVDAACGLVLTAYRPSASWWTSAGGTLLQVETLDHARKGGSPSSSQVAAILAGTRAPASPPKPEAAPPAEAPATGSEEVVVVPIDGSTDAPPSNGNIETPPPAAEVAVSPSPASAPPAEVPVQAQPTEVAQQTPEPEPPPPPSPAPPMEAPVQAAAPQSAEAPLPPVTAARIDAPVPEPLEPQTEVAAEAAPPPTTQPAAEVVPPPLSQQTPGTTGEAKPEPKTQVAAEVVPPPLSKQTPGTTGEVRKPATISSWRSDLPKAPATSGSPTAPPQSIATWRSATPAPASAPPSPAAPVRSDALPEAVKTTTPVYPATAKWLGLKGHVKLEIVVRADGTVGSRPRVLSATPAGRGFEESAVAAVREWRFSPATRGGVPVESKTTVELQFE